MSEGGCYTTSRRVKSYHKITKMSAMSYVISGHLHSSGGGYCPKWGIGDPRHQVTHCAAVVVVAVS